MIGRVWLGKVSPLAWGCVFVLAVSVPLTAKTPYFRVLDSIPPGYYDSSPLGISADGRVVVGTVWAAERHEAVRWVDGVAFTFGSTADGRVPFGASAVSANGDVIVGSLRPSPLYPEAFRWEDGHIVPLGDLPGFLPASYATGVSADGKVIVGSSAGPRGWQAVRWQDGLLSGLDGVPGGPFASGAKAVSADGRVVVGDCWTAIIELQPCRWDDGDPISVLEAFGDTTEGQALGVSADGSTVVGYFKTRIPPDSERNDAFYWRGSELVRLNDQLGDDRFYVARAVSGDGSVIVGDGIADGRYGPAVWDKTHGVRLLVDLLSEEYGIQLGDFVVGNIKAITPDGWTVIGEGARRINGNWFEGQRAWIAHLPPIIPMVVDVAPGRCPGSINLRNRGRLKIVVFGTESLDVAGINPTTLTLRRADGVGQSLDAESNQSGFDFSFKDAGSPTQNLNSDCHSPQRDGRMDLVVRIAKELVDQAFELQDVRRGVTIELRVFAELWDGTHLGGADTVKVRNPR